MSALDQVAAFNRQLCTDLLAQDVDAVVNAFAEDAALLAPGSELVSGHEAIRQWWEGFFAMRLTRVEMVTSYLALETPDAVVEVGTYEMEMTPPEGDPVADRGKYSVLFKRGPDGRLRYAVDALNSSLA